MQKPETRDGVRVPCELEARIEQDAGRPALRVIVRNLSTFGARLEGPDVAAAPESFELSVVGESGRTQRCRARKVWGNGEAIGVCFADRACA